MHQQQINNLNSEYEHKLKVSLVFSLFQIAYEQRDKLVDEYEHTKIEYKKRLEHILDENKKALSHIEKEYKDKYEEIQKNHIRLINDKK